MSEQPKKSVLNLMEDKVDEIVDEINNAGADKVTLGEALRMAMIAGYNIGRER